MMKMLDEIPEVTYLRAWAIAMAAQTREHSRERARDERGVTIVEWVIIASIVAAAAIAIAIVVTEKFKEKANTIPTE